MTAAAPILSFLAQHLWQSTLFAAAAGLLTFVLKSNAARVRYGVWLATSAKFFMPFTALIAVGRQFGWRTVAPAHTEVMLFVHTQIPIGPSSVSVPPTLSPSALLDPGVWPVFAAVWLCGVLAVLTIWALRWREVAAVVRNASLVEGGHELSVLRRLEAARGVRKPIRLMMTDAAVEPGVFGIVRPVLLWPRSIARHLTDQHIEAILGHEISHVRRLDNLTAAIHMAVQAIFWFHPLVWWLGARLVEERERACDEDVLSAGAAPHVYAEGILRTCEFYTESPLACVTGVTGSDLKKRIEQIMRSQHATPLGVWKRSALVAFAAAAVVAPVVVGAATAPPKAATGREMRRIEMRRVQIRRPLGELRLGFVQGAGGAAAQPTFETASVKPDKSGAPRVGILLQPGGLYTATNVTLQQLIQNAYRVQGFQVQGGPDWIKSDRFDIVAKAGTATTPAPAQIQLMMQALLADRFKVGVHREQRDGQVYDLVMAKTGGKPGPQLRPSDCMPGPPPSLCGGARVGPGTLTAQGIPIAQFANFLSNLVNRVVIDKTGLTGNVDVDLKWAPDPALGGGPGLGALPPGAPGAGPAAAPNDAPGLFTAIQEQLGLKLDSQRGAVDVLVIDHAEQPTAD